MVAGFCSREFMFVLFPISLYSSHGRFCQRRVWSTRFLIFSQCVVVKNGTLRVLVSSVKGQVLQAFQTFTGRKRRRERPMARLIWHSVESLMNVVWPGLTVCVHMLCDHLRSFTHSLSHSLSRQ